MRNKSRGVVVTLDSKRGSEVREHKGIRITLTYRPPTNDWRYSFVYSVNYHVEGNGSSMQAAFDAAKRRIDKSGIGHEEKRANG